MLIIDMEKLSIDYPLTTRGLLIGFALVAISSSLLMLGGASPKIWFIAAWMFMGCVMSLVVFFRRFATITAALWAAAVFYAAQSFDDPGQQNLASSSAVIMVIAFALIGYAQIKGFGREGIFGRDKISWKDAIIFLFASALFFALASGVYLPRAFA